MAKINAWASGPFVKWIEDNVTDVHAIEAVVFGDGYGGTGDAWVNVRGVSVYLDWKSRGADSGHGCYEEEVAQGGAYCSADYLIVPSADRLSAVRAPMPTVDVGMVVSIRPDGWEAYEYDIAKAAEAFELGGPLQVGDGLAEAGQGGLIGGQLDGRAAGHGRRARC